MNKTAEAHINFDKYVNENLSEGLLQCNINLTSLCQHRCIMCFREEKSLKRNNYIPLDKLKEYYSWFRSLGGTYVFISGGEPLLYPFFDEFLNYLEDLRYNVVIVTNGLLLNKYKKSLEKQNITEIRVSLLGLDTTHDKLVNKPGSFRTVIENIMDSEELFQKIQINFTALKSNFNEIEQLINFLINKIKIKKVAIGLPFVNRNNQLKLKNELLSIEQKKKFFNTIENLKLRYQNEIINTIYDKNQNARHYPFCNIGPSHFCINYDNQIWPCGEYEKSIINMRNIKNAYHFFKLFSKSKFFKKLACLDMKKCEACDFNCYCSLCVAQNYQNTGLPNKTSMFQCRAAKDIYEALHDR